jgi:hypothetical protein
VLTATTQTKITYYVSVSGTNFCEGAASTTGRKAVDVIVNPYSTGSTQITVTGTDTICTGSTTTLTAATTGITAAEYKWYTSATSTTPVYTGAAYTTPVLTATTQTKVTYYVSVSGTNFCEGAASTTGRKAVDVIVNPYSTGSTQITVTGTDTICTGSTTTLTAATTGITAAEYKWYTSATSTTPVYTGAAYTTPVLTATTQTKVTYYVSVSGTNFCEGAASTTGRKAVDVIVNPYSTGSTQITVTGTDTICTGSTTTLTAATTGVTAAEYKWYTSATSTTPVYTGATYTTPVLTATTQTKVTYYVSVSGTNFCEGAASTTGRKAVDVIVNPYSVGSTQITVTGTDTICTGSTTTLTAAASSVTGAEYKWYTSATSTTPVYTGAAYTTPVLTATTQTKVTYYVSVSGTNFCEGAASTTGRKSVDVTVNPYSVGSTQITVTGTDTICTGSTTTLTAASTGVTAAEYKWYTSATSTTPIYTGAAYTTPVLTATTQTKITYYVSVSGTNYCEGAASASGRKSVDVTVNPYSTGTQITVTGTDTICTGSTTTLTASTSGITAVEYKWYTSATSITPVYTGAAYTTPVLTATAQTKITYYVSVSGTNYCEGAASTTGRKAVDVIVNPYSVGSTQITVTGLDTICSGSSASLTATASGVTSPVFKWYATSTTTDVLYTGATYSPTLTATGNLITYTYYVSVSGANFCEGAANTTARKAVTVTVKPFSQGNTNLVARDTAICTGSSVALTVTAPGVDTPEYKWYANSTTTTPITTGVSGNTLTTGTLTSGSAAITYTYYVSVSGRNVCEGANNTTGRKAITVTVKAYSGPGDLTVTGLDTLCGSRTLTATATGVTNPIFKWYKNATGGAAFRTDTAGVSGLSHYSTSALTADTTFYVTVSGDNYCEGTVRDTVTAPARCFTLRGTVFPFVHYNYPAVDTLFTVTATLHTPPRSTSADPIGTVNRSTPLYSAKAIRYDGSIYVPGVPRDPGASGRTNNPGLPINWSQIGRAQLGTIDTVTVRPGVAPIKPVGLYTFPNVAPGTYVLKIVRAGCIPRYAKITVTGSGVLGHREIIPGDVNEDLIIDGFDIIDINNNLGYAVGHPNYESRYDANSSGDIDMTDVSLIKFYQDFTPEVYMETQRWLDEY